jgi:hypothetical protein
MYYVETEMRHADGTSHPLVLAVDHCTHHQNLFVSNADGGPIGFYPYSHVDVHLTEPLRELLGIEFEGFVRLGLEP